MKSLPPWIWLVVVVVSLLGILAALLTQDQRLANRSALVLLASFALAAVADILIPERS